jgi:hypothetical protein
MYLGTGMFVLCMKCIKAVTRGWVLLAVNSLTVDCQRISSGNLDFILNLQGSALELMEFEAFRLYHQEIRHGVTCVSITRLCCVGTVPARRGDLHAELPDGHESCVPYRVDIGG